jgi:hypothetical protein
MANRIVRRYPYTNIKKKRSRKKKVGVTLIAWPDEEALKANGITAEVMKRDEPRRGVTACKASPQ